MCFAINALMTNSLPRPRVLGGGIGQLRSSKSPESKEVLFPHIVIPHTPRYAGDEESHNSYKSIGNLVMPNSLPRP